jgi:glucose 1-dehydrogenase
MSTWQGKVAVVTGAAAGNGRAIALRYADHGADVAIADVNGAGMEETAAAIRERGRRVWAHVCDVSRKADVERLIAATVRELGAVDIAVANAGVVEKDTDCLRMSEEQWQRTIGVNLSGVFFTLQAAANQMVAQGRGGRLIAIASIMAEWGAGGTPAYCASKGGVRQLVRSFAIACGRYGITCNAIAPGFIDTAMTQIIKDTPGASDMLVDRTPVGRIGSPDDVASVAAFLGSDEAGFVTGATMTADGGITVGLYSAMVARMAEQRR